MFRVIETGPATKVQTALSINWQRTKRAEPSPIGIGQRRSLGMASGWGINGTKGRCYDFWIDFSECMSRCREPNDCALLREDYLECLHHAKEFQRRNRIYKEEQRKLRAATRKAKEGEDMDHHHG